MPNQKIYRLQWFVVAAATLFAVAHLARPDMPAISNWWGIVILPALGWLTSWFVLRRVNKKTKVFQKAFAGFLGALTIGLLLSFSFNTGHEQVSSYIFFGALFSGLIFPIYRAEYIFGFVLGMTFILGAILPAIAAMVGAAISVIFHFLIKPLFTWGFQHVQK
jgi:hypothetical protein